MPDLAGSPGFLNTATDYLKSDPKVVFDALNRGKEWADICGAPNQTLIKMAAVGSAAKSAIDVVSLPSRITGFGSGALQFGSNPTPSSFVNFTGACSGLVEHLLKAWSFFTKQGFVECHPELASAASTWIPVTATVGTVCRLEKQVEEIAKIEQGSSAAGTKTVNNLIAVAKEVGFLAMGVIGVLGAIFGVLFNPLWYTLAGTAGLAFGVIQHFHTNMVMLPELRGRISLDVGSPITPAV